MKLKYQLYLTSSSPRRINLLKKRGIEFISKVANTEEKIDQVLTPEENVKLLALEKSKAIEKIINKKKFIVLGVDTVISFQNKIFGKPENITQAKQFLKSFSDSWHKVVTGIAIVCPHKKISVVDAETTKVKFRSLSESIIDYYITNYNILDKAGAYGIQDYASFFVEKIEGCFFNVVGLPLSKLMDLFESHNLIDWG